MHNVCISQCLFSNLVDHARVDILRRWVGVSPLLILETIKKSIRYQMI